MPPLPPALSEEIFDGQPGHAGIHNTTNDLVNAIRDELETGRLSDAELAAKFGTLLDVSRDESNTAWPFPVAAFGVVYPGLSVTIPPVDRPVDLEYHAYGKVSEVGVGIFGFTLWETTSGAGVDIGGNTTSLIDKAGVFESLRHFHGSKTVDPLPVPTWRTFRLVGGVFRQSGTTGQAVTQSSGASNTRPAELKAVLQ